MGRRTAVGVLACALLLTGCAEKHEASQTLPTTARAASSPSTPALPVVGPADFPVPAEARQRTPAGVQAFTRYYIALMNRQAQSLDSQPLRDLSRGCQTCDELAQSYEKTNAAGHRFRGGEITIAGMGSAVVSDSRGESSFLLDESPTSVVDATGSVVEVRTSKPGRYSGGVVLKWDTTRSTWLMAQLDADPV